MMKIFFKKSIVWLLSMLLVMSFAGTAMASSNIRVWVNDKYVSFDVQPQVINNRVMVPMRAIFEALDASVNWNSSSQTISAARGKTEITLPLNSTRMYIKNGNTVTLDAAAQAINGRTMVPLRAISEAFDAIVEWNQNTKKVTIVAAESNETTNSGSANNSSTSLSNNTINTENSGTNTNSSTNSTNNSNSYKDYTESSKEDTAKFTVPLIDYEYAPMTVTAYYSTGRYWDENKISSLVFTKVELTNIDKYKVYVNMQGITDDSDADVVVYFYDANNRVLEQVRFFPSVEPNVEYNVLTSRYVDKDVIENATRIEFYSHSGKKAVKGTSSSNNSNSNKYNDESDNDSDDETDDSTENNNSSAGNDNSVSSTGNSGIDTLINYIATNGSKSGSAKRITRTTSDYTTTIAYNESGGFLRFTLKYNADDGKYVTFDYNIDSQTNSYITVAGVGTKASLVAACKADFDMSTYTSSTELDFEKIYDEGDGSLFEYVENYNEACNALVRVAIPAFGVQLTNSANVTLSDIGFTSY